MPYSVIFMGTPQFAVPILQALAADDRYDVKAAVTQPDRPSGRKKILTPSPVKVAAQALDLPVYQPEKISGSSTADFIVATQPDFIVTAAFGQFLPTSVLAAAKIAAVNTHASLLPKYRGGAPVHYAIMNGEQETGVSIMYMVKEMDAGDVIDVVKVPIGSSDNVGTMFDKLSIAGRDLLLATLPRLAAGTITATPQDRNQVSFSPNITREQQYLDVTTETAQALDWHIRGLYPTHPAFVIANGERVKLIDVTVVADTTTFAPGQIVAKDKHSFAIAAAQGTVLQINTLQPAGKGVMTAAAFLNGAGSQLTVGQQWLEVGNE